MAPRRRNPTSLRWSVRKDKPKPPKRRDLTDKDTSKLTDLFAKNTTGSHAPTGSGKTAIAAGVHLWPDGEQKVTIVVSPLLALEDEMVKTFKEQFDLEAVAISSEHGSCSPQVVKDILALKYQIILTSPEMLQSRTFVSRILRNPRFARHVVSLFVDEAHHISHWGADFRKKYASLDVIHAFLPRGTPVIAVTAIVTS
ncbi:P-loop containing nucleoside triphosphate hydrolase protein [Fomitopsis betulina]|nr:P-loop containing nucleoside triphosphate hydrolase protein [Fomitopsis betulina]